MNDQSKAELRRLAEAALSISPDIASLDAYQAFKDKTGPAVVISLLDEGDRLENDNRSKNGSMKAFGEQIAKLQRAVKNRDRQLAKSKEENEQLRAEVEALRSQKTEWQAECIKKGFEYVRESDDHYVVADPAEMVSLLRDLLGVDVRQKDGSDYGVSVSELKDQVEGLVNTLHSLEPMRKNSERYLWLRQRNVPLEGHDFLSTQEVLDMRIDDAMFKEGSANG